MEQTLRPVCEIDDSEEFSANRPLVSAIITTHDRRKLLEQALLSALSQTYQPMEIVVVDDNSTDDTRAFIEKMQEQYPIIRYVFISGEQSRGGNHARNVGIDAARGKWIAFLDDDDVWLKEKTERQMAYLLQHPEVQVISCDIIQTYITKKRTYQESIGYRSNHSPLDFFAQSWLNVTSTIIASKEALESVGKFDEQMPAQQELELSYRLCLKYEVDYLFLPLIRYNIYFNATKQLTTDHGVERYIRASQLIEQKFAKELEQLSPEQKRRREISIRRGSATRYYISNNGSMYRKTMKPILNQKWQYIVEYMASYILSYRQWCILKCILHKGLHR